jgi:hypothetical protein
VTFVEAATVFEDVGVLVNVGPLDPSRFIAVGFSIQALEGWLDKAVTATSTEELFG